ncbi:hypothetical protein AGABI2DRAFT_185880 [Agaricus bisporus var. bisporus H97]|uniref:hypothetical protein n=1 Tax=Agaricus bisporus var. bisporus (strain H97 / ATCC MYA-4626 / FGSC 10389) TaxID=936046 RepID=UPI00029F7C8B|nr:hypothetical protein AGABI2DRAFT_185880 [Agaricus bisporus var. bisporus H97]EKV46451.1 hypothetical protein AGABI2DRAFT_185880 [Agaricus bisporus var. bisporus H97]
MENTERLIRTWIATEKEEEVKEIVAELSADRTNFVNVVKGLGEYLTADEEDLRRKAADLGVEFLSLILASLPTEKVNKQSTRVLSTFYCGKLEDFGTVIPALKGIQTLVKLPTCSALEVQSILRSMFSHVRVKGLVQSVRFVVFSILDSLVANHREVLQAMGKEFLDGYVGLADGEKDPRILILAFAIARVILIEFDIRERIETLFNITFCYFPITFRPPPNDPYGISADDLRNALRGCLSATPYFGPLAIPVFLEKLLAGTRVSKRDTLETMGICLPVYGSALAQAEGRKLWNSLKLEIFQPTDTANQEEALRTTQILVKTIYEADKSAEDDTDIKGLARDACEECISILKEPEKSQANAAAKVLCAFMSTTPSVAKYTISQAIPHLVKLFHSPDEAGNLGPILTVLSEFIITARDSSSKLSSQPARTDDDMEIESTVPPLLPYKDSVLGVLTVGLKTASSRRPALAGLQGMVTSENLLNDAELTFVVHNVNEIMEAAADDPDGTSAVLDLLSTVSNISARIVEEQTLPLLFSSIPDVPPARDAIQERVKILDALSALEALCIQAQLFETMVIRLTTKLDLICVPNSTTIEELELYAAYAHWILTTVVKTLQKKIDKDHPDVAKYIDRLVPKLFNLLVSAAFTVSDEIRVATDHRLVKKAGELVTLVVQTLPLERQESYAALLYDALLGGNIKPISEGQQKIASDKKLLVLSDSAPIVQKNLLALFTAVIISLRKEVQPVVSDLNAFLDNLVQWSLTRAESAFQRDAALELLASILNKHADSLKDFLDHLLSSFWDREIRDIEVAPQRRRNAIKAWSWASKALLIRNHPIASHFIDKLFEVFHDETIGWDAARIVGEVAAPDDVLTKKHHAVIRILYAQKFLNSVLPKITTSAKDSRVPREQTASLVALTSLIKSIPKPTYQHELQALIPLLIRGLELPDTDIRLNIIDTFLVAAEGDSPEHCLITGHAPTLVDLMLKNSNMSEMPSLRVRISALKFLQKLPSIVRYDILHPSKPFVMKELGKALDDPKRVVRKEAVDARASWFAYHGST